MYYAIHLIQYTIIHVSLIIDYYILDMSRSINLLIDLRLQRGSSFIEFCKFSLAVTQVFDDFLLEEIFRVDILVTDQFVSSNGTVLLSNFIFLFLLIEEIR